MNKNYYKIDICVDRESRTVVVDTIYTHNTYDHNEILNISDELKHYWFNKNCDKPEYWDIGFLSVHTKYEIYNP